TSADDGKKRVRSSAVILLVCQNFRCFESHDSQKLSQKPRAEMPPGMPEKVLRSRRQTANWCTFQVWIKHISDNERRRFSPALLNYPERVAAMQQHRCHHGDVEFSKGRRQIVNIAVIHPGLGMLNGVTEPIGILQTLHHYLSWAK